jgi:hypothetical protein
MLTTGRIVVGKSRTQRMQQWLVAGNLGLWCFKSTYNTPRSEISVC